jgi:RNA polymerase sigma factor (sigma-70 family)
MQAVAINMTQAKANKIDQTVREERGRLLNFIRQSVSRAEEAEDILQDVLYQFVIGYDEIRSIDRASSWLFRVARNKIIDSFRKKKPQAFTDMAPAVGGDEQPLMLEDILPDIQNLPEKELIREMVWARIDEALNDLPAKQRQVFILHEFEQKSFKEIEEITKDPLNTLLSRKRYAVLALRVALQDLYDEMKND